MLLSRVLGVPMVQGAELIGRMRGSDKLEKVRKALRDAPDGEDAARIVKQHKKDYERYSGVRNRIAHSRCAGVWARDRDFIVFAVFEKVGDNELAVDAVPIQEMQRATEWGLALAAWALKIVDTPHDGA